jgi:hypothetical protein
VTISGGAIRLNIYLGEYEAYVRREAERAGLSASDIVRDALREKIAREREAEIERRIALFIVKGEDSGPPDGVDAPEWRSRLTAAVEQVRLRLDDAAAAISRGEGADGEAYMQAMRERRGRRRAASAYTGAAAPEPSDARRSRREAKP